MKKYLVNSIREQEDIGFIETNDDFSSIQIHLNQTKNEKYHDAICRLIDMIILRGNFSVTFDKREVKIAGSDELFFKAIVQSLLVNMDTLVASQTAP